MRTRRSGSCGKNLPTLTTQRRAHNPECGGRLRPLAIANDLLVDGVAVREQGSPATSPADVACSYRGVESILRHRLDETPAEPLARTEQVDDDNVRGPMRGGAGRRRQPERQRAVWRRS